MNVIEPSFQILHFDDDALERIEIAARNCFQSEPKGNSEEFVKRLIERQHLTPLEMSTVTVRIITDRGVLAELTRHRLASFSVESTRYVNYSKKGLEFIKPCFWQEGSMNYESWIDAMTYAELYYMKLIKSGATPQEARSVLPNSLKTEIIMSANLREWLWVFKLRCSDKAHPDMVFIMRQIKNEFAKRLPVIFG